MTKKIVFGALMFLLMSACTSNEIALDTGKLSVEKNDIHTIYAPVERKIAEEAITFDMEYPSYVPFDHEHTKMEK
ncbi:hypothetical protein J416_07732 [Gracilibacillus halophilus YIM-C55.5]|uniref:Lipoprotein n=1 Tax=Gracilibacillus halophilus YIM-C55.5 TaxID=1308866 RepID=N4WCY2_9BACI|nr:hypothetical protein [Gracilibacillus halophilus]ENH97069.1 hypothetical protein J416_07732 [Gracilibacillus halophilus YIM-C55.5]